jgi:hypothetical protein
LLLFSFHVSIFISGWRACPSAGEQSIAEHKNENRRRTVAFAKERGARAGALGNGFKRRTSQAARWSEKPPS